MAGKIIFVVILVYLFSRIEATATNTGKKLVIDHDGGADDAFAVTMSLLYEKYFDGPKVVALTTSYGNVNLNQSIINSDRLLALCDRRDIPIYSGAHQALISDLVSDYFYGYDGLGDDGYTPSSPIELQREHAAVALLELSKKYEGELIIVAIGPLTNIALAARMDHNFIRRLSHLYVGAGHIQSELHQKPEFNAHMDPEAYRIVADSAIFDKVTFIPYSQIQLSLNISWDWRRNDLGTIQTPIVQALNGFERISSTKKASWIDLDPAVASIALNNDIAAEFRNTSNDIIMEGDKRGINTNDFSSTNPNGRMVYSADMERHKKFLLDVYSADLKQ